MMNRICRRFEEEFDNYIARHNADAEFDYSIMRSGETYTSQQYNAIHHIYTEYVKRTQDYMQFAAKERIDNDENHVRRSMMLHDFVRECEQVCSNSKQLCNILLDMCYKKEGSKQFVWDIASDEIVDNLVRNNGNRLMFPMRDDNGDFEFGGERFAIAMKSIGESDNEYCS